MMFIEAKTQFKHFLWTCFQGVGSHESCLHHRLERGYANVLRLGTPRMGGGCRGGGPQENEVLVDDERHMLDRLAIL